MPYFFPIDIKTNVMWYERWYDENVEEEAFQYTFRNLHVKVFELAQKILIQKIVRQKYSHIKYYEFLNKKLSKFAMLSMRFRFCVA